MSERVLPEGWVLASIDQVSHKGEQRKPDAAEQLIYVDIGSIDRESKVIASPQRLSGSDAPSRARKVIRAGDVLVSLTRPNLNAVALVGKEYDGQIASTGFEVIKPVGIDSRFVFFLVRDQAFIDAISGRVQGALYPAAKSSDVKGYQFPLPPSEEQKVIANKLDELLAQVNNLKARLDAIPAILKRFRQSVLAAAVSGRLTDGWRGAPELTGWEEVCLGDVIEKPRYGTSSKSQKHGDVPVLRMGNLQQGEIDWGDLVYTSDPSEIEKYTLKNGDVLFNRTNSPDLVGKTSIYRGGREAVYAGYLILLRSKSRLVPDYLNYHLNSPRARRYCKLVKSDGVSQSNINAKKVAAYPMLLPPIEEQAEIVRRVDQLFAFADQVEQQVKNARARVDKLTQSILAKAFRGELTTEWRAENPELIGGEHSAAALLERIKTEKAKQTPARTRRGGRKATVTS